MALVEANLMCSDSSNKIRVWTYFHPTDNVAAIVASGYFNDATEELRQGDVILAVGVLDTAPVLTSVAVTSATGAATVTTVKTA